MARKEAALDLWVADRLTECDIEFTSQGSSIKEIDNALKDASSAPRETLAILNTFRKLDALSSSSKIKRAKVDMRS